jgi:4-hydroxybenzoate polyprenyltransferase
MRQLGAWAQACHPLPALTVAVVATGLAVTAGGSWARAAVVGGAVLAGQLSVGWLNDLVDADRDAAVGRPDKPVAAGRLRRSAVAVAVAVAAVTAVALSLLTGVAATMAHLAALVSAWGYDLGLKATAVSVVPYAVSFGLLPGIAALAATGTWPPLWMVVAAALLGCAAHFANVLPDLEDDEATGVRGLPHRVGATASRLAAAGLVLTASAVLVLGPPGVARGYALVVLAASFVIVTGGLLVSRHGRPKAAFHGVLVVALADVALLVLAGP